MRAEGLLQIQNRAEAMSSTWSPPVAGCSGETLLCIHAALPSVTLSLAATCECEGLHSPASPGRSDIIRTAMYCALKYRNPGNSLQFSEGNNSVRKEATDLM